MPVDAARERAVAWAKFLEEEAFAELEPTTVRAPIARALDDCRQARSSLTMALGAIDRATREGWPHNGIAREWVACLDQILAIADRACGMLHDSDDFDDAAGDRRPVWEGARA